MIMSSLHVNHVKDTRGRTTKLLFICTIVMYCYGLYNYIMFLPVFDFLKKKNCSGASGEVLFITYWENPPPPVLVSSTAPGGGHSP